MRRDDPEEQDFERLCVCWGGQPHVHSQLHAVTGGDTARRTGTRRVWAEKKKQHFLELERKFEHYSATMSPLQTLVQEEPKSYPEGTVYGILAWF